eukprot:SAG22_NODE_5220_length_1059_cov_1.067708_2_plen_134_part_01
MFFFSPGGRYLCAGAGASPRNVTGLTPLDAAVAPAPGKTSVDVADCRSLLGRGTDVARTAPPLPAAAVAAAAAGIDVTTLIAPGVEHAGAGSFAVDGGFGPAFMSRLDKLHTQLAVVGTERANTHAVRSYYCDI